MGKRKKRERQSSGWSKGRPDRTGDVIVGNAYGPVFDHVDAVAVIQPGNMPSRTASLRGGSTECFLPTLMDRPVVVTEELWGRSKMNENTWLTVDEPLPMLNYLASKGLANPTKGRMLSAALFHKPEFETRLASIDYMPSVENNLPGLHFTFNGDQWHHILTSFVPNYVLCAHIREVYGNPFRAPAYTLPLDILKWRDNSIRKAATKIYEDAKADSKGYKAWHEMAILGDMLEEAGCDNEDVLAHARGFQRKGDGSGFEPVFYRIGQVLANPVGDPFHCRGCWLIDMLREVEAPAQQAVTSLDV